LCGGQKQTKTSPEARAGAPKPAVENVPNQSPLIDSIDVLKLVARIGDGTQLSNSITELGRIDGALVLLTGRVLAPSRRAREGALIVAVFTTCCRKKQRFIS
jgi:hypothetical protein